MFPPFFGKSELFGHKVKSVRVGRSKKSGQNSNDNGQPEELLHRYFSPFSIPRKILTRASVISASAIPITAWTLTMAGMTVSKGTVPE